VIKVGVLFNIYAGVNPQGYFIHIFIINHK